MVKKACQDKESRESCLTLVCVYIVCKKPKALIDPTIRSGALFSLLTATSTCWEVFGGFLCSLRLESTQRTLPH